MQLRYGQLLIWSQGRQEAGQRLGKHRLAGAGWPSEEDVVVARCGDGEGALGLGLAVDIIKQGRWRRCCWFVISG